MGGVIVTNPLHSQPFPYLFIEISDGIHIKDGQSVINYDYNNRLMQTNPPKFKKHSTPAIKT